MNGARGPAATPASSRSRRAHDEPRGQSQGVTQTKVAMARVAGEMVQKAGAGVDKLLDLRIRNASAELTTYYLKVSYTRL